MKQTLIFFLFAIPLFCMAQSGSLPRVYEYDEVGNRIVRKVVYVAYAPSAPPDSSEYMMQQPSTTEFYVEKIAQTEIKIYPNPTTEKVTLEISGWETLRNGNFTLYSLTGQLLQDHPVHSLTTTVSLSTLPKGTYILKVQINNKTEDWKIIKN